MPPSCSFKSTGTLIFIFAVTGTCALATALILGVTHILSLPTVYFKLMRVGEWVQLSGVKI